MRYLIASDLHGSLLAVQRLLQIFDEGGYDRLLLLCDFSNYGPRNSVPADLDASSVVSLLNERADRIVAVRGNCDSEVDQMLFGFDMMCDYTFVTEGGKVLFLTHGHIYNAERRPGLGIDVLLYGHTHLWRCERQPDGLVVCNPGSPTFPKGGNPPTYATLEDSILAVRLLEDGRVLRQCAL
ncbi:MAG: phosphodiesterase [Bacteroidaceae bacterium]|nr:phosphodiesterase [Bacteroidaceae bacterium]